ncbi:MAG: nucleotidyltransferase family protein [Bacteroidales bacterium]|nr:nucleotidyltransferase family protein [Bacteroidales bacterium]
MKENFSAIILAAGSSGRMGQPKALLPFDPQRCFARKLADEFLSFGCQRVVMVTNAQVAAQAVSAAYKLNGIEIVINPNPELGRFYSFYLALQAIGNHYVFMTNADNPFVGADILRALWRHAMQADYVYPVYEGRGGHPILISPRIVRAARAETNPDINLKEYLNRFSKACIPVPNDQILININTPEEYTRLIADGKLPGNEI